MSDGTTTEGTALGPNAGSIDHVAIATHDLERAGRFFGDVLGATFIAGGDDERLGIRTAQFRLEPGFKVEIMQPLDEESYLHAFIEKHGEGFHHMTTFFDDLEALIPRLEAAGFDTVDPDFSDPTWYEVFVRPRSGFGALLQLTQTSVDWQVPHTHITFADVAAGRVRWNNSETELKSI